MLKDGKVDLRDMQAFLFDLKRNALAIETRSTGLVKQTMFARIQVLDAFMIFLNTKMEAQNMEKLDLTMGTKPIPTKEVKAEEEAQAALARALAEVAKTVPVGTSQPLPNLAGRTIKSMASKMWTLRTEGRLPERIKPSISKGKLFMVHMTDEELEELKAKTKKDK